LADLQQTVYSHKWSPVSCRSSAGQGKFAGKRPTFYTAVPRNKQSLGLRVSETKRRRVYVESDVLRIAITSTRSISYIRGAVAAASECRVIIR